jgi:hypothetical protein
MTLTQGTESMQAISAKLGSVGSRIHFRYERKGGQFWNSTRAGVTNRRFSAKVNHDNVGYMTHEELETDASYKMSARVQLASFVRIE